MATAGTETSARTREGTTRLRVAVLSGGRSSEHEVSLSSGAAVREGLESVGHEVVDVRIGRNGRWHRAGEQEPLSLTPGAGLLDADVVFPVLHGRFGEDGTVQGLLEMLDVAYVGAGVASSALCMDKVLFKELMTAAGTVPQVAYIDVGASRFVGPDRQALLEQVMRLGLPVFVKPAHLGSSVGIVKVTAEHELIGAIESAFAYDARVIVEAAAAGLEVECGVLGLTASERGPAGTAAQVSLPGEIAYESDFYDFEAKYEPGGMDLVIPARISETATERVRELALQAFAYAGCEGLARVDFFVEGERVLLNELNTMPGFTPTSVYAKLMAASGVTYPEVVDRLCRLGIERFAQQGARAF
ncbi:MAG TPA: D-alanine--D-alanine ligase family protein [Solirubrobacteraceae bacterium]|nr:D-alanine--D-alanine ligase family protein [Solirubrobacteraceae bacterium]